MSVLRAALTETRNVFAGMPATADGLDDLADRLEDLRAANVAHHVDLVARAAARGVALLGMGELCSGPYFALERRALWRGLAEDARDGPTVTALRAAAREHGLVLVVPIYELDSASGRRFNSAVLIERTGEVVGLYRKTHVPEGENERAAFCETFYYEPSDGRLGEWPANVSTNRFFPVFETSVGRLGVAICYDRHFPGAVATLARQGAQVVLSPAVTFGAVSRRMWDLEFAVDAARHRVFVGGSNRRGAEPPWNVEYFGASHFVGPAGRLPSLADDPELVVSDLDLAGLERPDSSGWDLARDARPEIYD